MFFGFMVLCFAAVPIALSERLHKRMTIEQAEEIFKTPYHLVPDYEVVQFHHSRLNKRDNTSPQLLTVTAFGNNLKLWVKPSEGILAGKKTPVFKVKRGPRDRGVVYTEVPNAMLNIGTLLEDPVTGTSLVVRTNARGKRSMDGFIGSKNLVVRSLPDSIAHELMENHSTHDSESFEGSETTRSDYHIVFKRAANHSAGSYKSLGFNDTRSRVSRDVTGTSATIPNILYPEIMVVIDYDLSLLIGDTLDKILSYTVAFWNGVDLFYRTFEHPKFRFNIARIVISEARRATSYISDKFNDNVVDAYGAIDLASRHFYQILETFPMASYDAVVTMTSFKISEGADDENTLGIAMQEGACSLDNNRRRMKSVAIIKDDGSFDGVSTAAHEFAHLMDAEHDTNEPGCLATDGYLMSDETGIISNVHKFSKCSVRELRDFLRTNKASCFYNKPTTTDPLPRTLPGTLRDRNHQCKALKKGNNCYVGPAKQVPCLAVYCYDLAQPQQCKKDATYAPPDGAFCAQGKVCLHGQCVKI